jgi:hypothetical protein
LVAAFILKALAANAIAIAAVGSAPPAYVKRGGSDRAASIAARDKDIDMKRILKGAVLALGAAVPLICVADADADPGTLTPSEVRYLAQLNSAGVPFTDPYAAVTVGLDACEVLHGGRSDIDRYAEDLGNAGGGSWTHAQQDAMLFAAGSFLCP